MSRIAGLRDALTGLMPARGGLIHRFARDCEAATMVEFALISVPFLGLLFAIFETALLFFTMQSVEAATTEAARHVMTGQAQGNGAVTNADQFKTSYLCTPTAPMVRILPSYINCANIVVDVRKATTWTTAATTNAFFTETTHQYCTGTTSDIIVLRVGYPMPVFLSILAMNNLSNGGTYKSTAGLTTYSGTQVHLIVATAVFRNEPFPGVTQASGC